MDRAAQDAAWSANALEASNGFVALEDTYTQSVGLPESQRWPWSDSKGVYILASSYELHCVHVLHQIAKQAYNKSELSWHYDYTMECLNLLRDTVMCNADNELLSTGPPLYTHTGIPNLQLGASFNRTCRDWDKLQEWARGRSACWQPVNIFDRSFPDAERYKFCPDGSRPWEQKMGPSDTGF